MPESGEGGADRALDELLERVPAELSLAERAAADGEARGGLDEVERDFVTDPCHFLRRACQLADYGAWATVKSTDENRGLPR